jgi:serine phosphatase RsbU (regulator of sigma subunit)
VTSADPTERPDPIRSLLQEMHLLAPERFAERAGVHARALGFSEAVMYLVDYGQLALQPLGGEDVPERQELSIESPVAGRCFRQVETILIPGEGGAQRLWVPLLDGVERLGVVELLADRVTDELVETAKAYVSLLAELLTVNDEYTDLFARLRRRQTMSLAAEIQWELLPPLTFATDRVVVSGALEPAYEIGGDSFDYAVNGSAADVLVLDAVGHGLPAALLATAAIGAYRHARRDLHDLPDIAAAVNRVIAENFPGSQFATAAIARLDLDTGRFRWVNAGHPDPLVLRDGAFVRPPACRPQPPLGLQVREPEVCEMQLHPGDRVLVYSDGIVEARSLTGEFFGEERLAEFVLRAGAEGDAAPEALRRLMRTVLEHQGDRLQDDASIVVLEWRTGTPQHLLP